MNDMQSFLSVLDTIELNEEQVKALNEFFKIHKEKLYQNFLEEMRTNNAASVDLSEYIKKEEAQQQLEDFKKDCERAFELFEQDAEKAFQLATEDLKQQYTEQMAKAISEIYADIEARVKKDFMESKEYTTLMRIKDMIIPLLENNDNDLIQKLKAIAEEKEKIELENKQLAKEKTIAILLKDIPEKYYETVSSFISKGKDEEEVIERFNTILDILEKKEFSEQHTNTVNEEYIHNILKTQQKPTFIRKITKTPNKKDTNVITEQHNITKTKKDAEHVFEYETIKKELEAKENTLQPFTEAEYQLLQRVAW